MRTSLADREINPPVEITNVTPSANADKISIVQCAKNTTKLKKLEPGLKIGVNIPKGDK